MEKKPHPHPLSEWRGAWRLLVGWEKMVSGIIDNCIFESKKSFWEWHPLHRRGLGRLLVELKKRPSPFEEGVSSHQREALLIARKRPLQIEKGVSLIGSEVLLIFNPWITVVRKLLDRCANYARCDRHLSLGRCKDNAWNQGNYAISHSHYIGSQPCQYLSKRV